MVKHIKLDNKLRWSSLFSNIHFSLKQSELDETKWNWLQASWVKSSNWKMIYLPESHWTYFLLLRKLFNGQNKINGSRKKKSCQYEYCTKLLFADNTQNILWVVESKLIDLPLMVLHSCSSNENWQKDR